MEEATSTPAQEALPRKRHLGAMLLAATPPEAANAPLDLGALRAAYVAALPDAALPGAAQQAPAPPAARQPTDNAASEQLRRLPAQLTLLETQKLEELALHEACETNLREIRAQAHARASALTAGAAGLAGQRMTLAEWSAHVASTHAAQGSSAEDVRSYETLASFASRALECIAALQRRREKRHNKNVLQLKALQEAMERLTTLQAEKNREAECRVHAEKTAERLGATLAREKRNAVDCEFAHQVRHEQAAALERGDSMDGAMERALHTAAERVSGDMLSQVDTINRANRRAGNRVTEWDTRDATEGAEAPAPKRAQRARPRVPVFESAK